VQAPPVQDVPRISKPTWVRLPDTYDMDLYYPPDARLRRLSGRSVMQCFVTDEGRLEKCRVLSEEPAGSGFGAATLKLAPKFQMQTKTSLGQPVGGAAVMIPVRWTPPY
jgi:protein TonB